MKWLGPAMAGAGIVVIVGVALMWLGALMGADVAIVR